jgi:amino acid efflux transporter
VLAVALLATGAMAVAYAKGWGAEDLLVVPNSLVIATYLIAMAAALRLVEGRARLFALVGLALCAGIFPFAGASLLLPLGVGVAALVYRWLTTARRRRGYGTPSREAAAAGTEAAEGGATVDS